MTKVIMLRGIPASGKSTWAEIYVKKHARAVGLNKDSLREMLYFSTFPMRLEREIVKIEKELAARFLKLGYDVVIDDTNLVMIYENQWRKIAHENNAGFKIVDLEIDLEEAIKRDEARSKPVGKKVIKFLNIIKSKHRKMK